MPHTAFASVSGKCLLAPRALRFEAAEMRVGPHGGASSIASTRCATDWSVSSKRSPRAIMEDLPMSTKIPGDRLFLGLISVVRTLILDLSEKGLLDSDEFIQKLQQVAIAHREVGDPNNLADAIHAISEHLAVSDLSGG